MRVAIYVRVSTEEQAHYGFSINAQKESLLKYAKDHSYNVVDVYSDEGVSGGRLDRPALNHLLDDVRSNKIDMILFIKLDRWFRSVAHYYKIQEILDEYHVVWRTTEEEYETETSSGKFKVNIMLSVSQQMKDATSERIKFVFDSKIKNGGAITGSQPIGYKVAIVDGVKKVIKDLDTAPIVEDMFSHFEMYQSAHRTALYLNNKYGLSRTCGFMKRTLSNPMYYGSYRGIDNYCEPYIDKSKWDFYQDILKTKNLKANTRRCYMFSGLLFCSSCNRRMAAKTYSYKSCSTAYYLCHYHIINRTCDNSCSVRESDIENYLLSFISNYLNDYNNFDFLEIESASKNDTTVQSKIDALNLEKENITKAFIKSWISEEEANSEHDRINKEIDKLKNKKTTIKKVTSLGSDWRYLYDSLSVAGKQMWWRSIIKRIVIDSKKYKNGDPNYITVDLL